MKTESSFPHTGCINYISNYDIGFRVISPEKGEIYKGKRPEHHSLVFILDGEVEFSYDEYINRRFLKGDIFFIPQASAMFSEAIEDSRMLILTFNNRTETLCDNCTLSRYAKNTPEIKYDFRSLKMTPVIWNFVNTLVEYINLNMRCDYLHMLKQKELFVILQYCYSKEQIMEILYPVIGHSNFRSYVLENYNFNMSMSDLALTFNMSPKSFSRKFIANFKMTFRDWILKQKVKHIKLRLSMPDAVVYDIMRDFNFSDLSHFYRFCKKHYQCNPTEYMMKLKRENRE